MRKDIHPEYHEAVVKCVCGNEFKTRSTLKEINVEICAACHPFFTGQQKLIDSAGRVDRFLKKYGKDYAGGTATVEKPAPEPPKDEPAKAASEEPAAEKKAEEAEKPEETPEAAADDAK